MAKTNTAETNDLPDNGDAPLIDLNEASLKKLIARAKKRGVITVDELNAVTGEMSTDQIEDFTERLLTADLTHEEVFSTKGHGVYYADERRSSRSLVAVTGPQRGRLRGSRLRPYFAAPHGDMMLSGCFGLLDAFAEKYPNARDVIAARLAA